MGGVWVPSMGPFRGPMSLGVPENPIDLTNPPGSTFNDAIGCKFKILLFIGDTNLHSGSILQHHI